MIKCLLVFLMATTSWSFLFSSKKEDKPIEASSIVLDKEDTPVGFVSPKLEVNLKEAVNWKRPNYNKSIGSIGYSKDTFVPPKGLEVQVNFWKNIYTKYSSWQGVLHDSEHIDHIFAEVDFSEIMTNDKLTDRQKRKAKKKLVKQMKKEIVARLLNLENRKDSTGLSGEDLRIWQMYEKVEGKSKFKQASRAGRLRFQLGQSDYFLNGIYSSGRYIEEMEAIFESYNLPIELTRMPFVESSFNLKARSKVGASGIWQFMRNTGKQYMKVNTTADYRNHPISSTIAAAKKLRYNYKKTGTWPLAITGYNYGPSGIYRLSEKLKTKDLVEIIKKEETSRFGFASRNFYASFLAALQVEKEAGKYFAKPKWMPPVKAKVHKLDKQIRYNSLQSLFKEYNFDFDLYNPQFSYSTKKYNALISRGYRVYYPEVVATEMWAKVDTLRAPRLVAKGSDGEVYKVRAGDTLSQIAENHNVKVRDIVEWNDMSSSRIYAGQKISIPR